MQQFFLFCTILIIVSEAFSEKLHGSQILPSVRRKSRLSCRHKYLNPNIFNGFNFPISLVASTSENPDYESSFFVPLRGHGFEPKCDKNHFSRKKWRFSSLKKLLNKRQQKQRSTSNVPVSSQSLKNFWLLGPELRYEPHKNFLNSFGDIFDPQRNSIKNRNQYIVCVYPVLNHIKKRTLRFLKNSGLPALKRQYLINLKNKTFKNKRSANSLLSDNNEISYKENKLKVAESKNHKNIDFNMTNFISPNNFMFNTSPYTVEDAFLQNNDKNKNENIDTHTSNVELANNFRPNLSFTNKDASMEEKNGNSGSINNQNSVDIKKPSSESPKKIKFYVNNDLGNTERDSPLSPLSTSHTDMHSAYLGVTQPSVALPTINFKFPFDPNLQESSLRRDSQVSLKPVKKETYNLENEINTKETSFQNLEKLRQILEEVKSALKFSINVDTSKKEKGAKKKEKKKKKKEKKKDDVTNNSTNIKDKIDQVAIPILKNISEELAKFSNMSTSKPFSFFMSESKKSEKLGKSDSQKTNESCSLNGNWTSTGLGIEMTFTVMPNMMLKVDVNSEGEAIINKNWSIHGLTLVKRGGPLMLAAVYPQKRKIASFLGQCKVCKDEDLIFGAWTIYFCVRKYTDLWRAVETKLDILQKKTSEE